MDKVPLGNFRTAVQAEFQFLEDQEGVELNIYRVYDIASSLDSLAEMEIDGGNAQVLFIPSVDMNRTFDDKETINEYYAPKAHEQDAIDRMRDPDQEYVIEGITLAKQWGPNVLILGELDGAHQHSTIVPAMESAVEVAKEIREEERAKVDIDDIQVDEQEEERKELLEEYESEAQELIDESAEEYAEFQVHQTRNVKQELQKEIESKRDDLTRIQNRLEEKIKKIREKQRDLRAIQNNQADIKEEERHDFKTLEPFYPDAYLGFEFNDDKVIGYTSHVTIQHGECSYPMGFYKVIVTPDRMPRIKHFLTEQNDRHPHISGRICWGGYEDGINSLVNARDYIDIFPFVREFLRKYGTAHAMIDIEAFKCQCHDGAERIPTERALRRIYG